MKNQKGFAVVEGLLLLVLVGIIAGTGWYVYSARDNVRRALNDTSAAGNSQIANSKKQFTVKNIEPGIFAYKDVKLTYTMPDKWSVWTDPYDASSSDNGSKGLYIASPDFKTDSQDDLECSGVIGMRFGIFITGSYQGEPFDGSEITKMLSPGYSSDFVQNVKPAMLGGQKAAQFYRTPGECGWFYVTEANYKGYDVQIESALGDQDLIIPYKSIYNDLVSSIRFLN